jgi:hypothetical protein
VVEHPAPRGARVRRAADLRLAGFLRDLWPEDRIAWFGNALFALMAIALVLVMAGRVRAAGSGGNLQSALESGRGSFDVGE